MRTFRLAITLLAVALCFNLVGCGDDDPAKEEPIPEPPVEEMLVDTTEISLNEALLVLDKAAGDYKLYGDSDNSERPYNGSVQFTSNSKISNRAITISKDSITVNGHVMNTDSLIYYSCKINSNLHTYYRVLLNDRTGYTSLANGTITYYRSEYWIYLYFKEDRLYQVYYMEFERQNPSHGTDYLHNNYLYVDRDSEEGIFFMGNDNRNWWQNM